MRLSALRGLACALLLSVPIGVVAGLQLLGRSRDYENYLYFFDWLRNASFGSVLEYRFEPGFALIAAVLAAMHLSGVAIYVVIASMCLFIKYWALSSTRNYWLVLLTFTAYYACRYLVLFEMTVLRATVAFAIAFYVFYRRTGHERTVAGIILLLLAVTMHYSAIVLLPVYLVRPHRRTQAVVIAVVTAALVVVAKDAALAVLPEHIGVFRTYQNLHESTFLPLTLVLDLLIAAFGLAFWRDCDPLMKTCVLGLLVAAAFHFSLVEYSLFASRFRDLLGVFALLFVVRTVAISSAKVKIATLGLAVASSAVYLYGYFVADPLLS